MTTLPFNHFKKLLVVNYQNCRWSGSFHYLSHHCCRTAPLHLWWYYYITFRGQQEIIPQNLKRKKFTIWKFNIVYLVDNCLSFYLPVLTRGRDFLCAFELSSGSAVSLSSSGTVPEHDSNYAYIYFSDRSIIYYFYYHGKCETNWTFFLQSTNQILIVLNRWAFIPKEHLNHSLIGHVP